MHTIPDITNQDHVDSYINSCKKITITVQLALLVIGISVTLVALFVFHSYTITYISIIATPSALLVAQIVYKVILRSHKANAPQTIVPSTVVAPPVPIPSSDKKTEASLSPILEEESDLGPRIPPPAIPQPQSKEEFDLQLEAIRTSLSESSGDLNSLSQQLIDLYHSAHLDYSLYSGILWEIYYRMKLSPQKVMLEKIVITLVKKEDFLKENAAFATAMLAMLKPRNPFIAREFIATLINFYEREGKSLKDFPDVVYTNMIVALNTAINLADNDRKIILINIFIEIASTPNLPDSAYKEVLESIYYIMKSRVVESDTHAQLVMITIKLMKPEYYDRVISIFLLAVDLHNKYKYEMAVAIQTILQANPASKNRKYDIIQFTLHAIRECNAVTRNLLVTITIDLISEDMLNNFYIVTIFQNALRVGALTDEVRERLIGGCVRLFELPNFFVNHYVHVSASYIIETIMPFCTPEVKGRLIRAARALYREIRENEEAYVHVTIIFDNAYRDPTITGAMRSELQNAIRALLNNPAVLNIHGNEHHNAIVARLQAAMVIPPPPAHANLAWMAQPSEITLSREDQRTVQQSIDDVQQQPASTYVHENHRYQLNMQALTRLSADNSYIPTTPVSPEEFRVETTRFLEIVRESSGDSLFSRFFDKFREGQPLQIHRDRIAAMIRIYNESSDETFKEAFKAIIVNGGDHCIDEGLDALEDLEFLTSLHFCATKHDDNKFDLMTKMVICAWKRELLKNTIALFDHGAEALESSLYYSLLLNATLGLNMQISSMYYRGCAHQIPIDILMTHFLSQISADSLLHHLLYHTAFDRQALEAACTDLAEGKIVLRSQTAHELHALSNEVSEHPENFPDYQDFLEKQLKPLKDSFKREHLLDRLVALGVLERLDL